MASAYTIEDDAYNFMNVMDWQKLDFNKFYGYTSIDSRTEGNLGAAFHVGGSNVLGITWRGNTWDGNPHNDFNVMYGWNNMAIRGGIIQYSEDSKTINGVTVDSYQIYVPNFEFGMNVTDKLAFEAGFGIGFGSVYAEATGIEMKISQTIPALNAMVSYNILDKGNMSGTLGLGYEGSYGTTTTEATVTILGTSTTTKETVNTNQTKFTPFYKMNVAFSDTFTYGLSAAIPFTFSGTSYSVDSDTISETSANYVDFKICNGFRAALAKDKVNVYGGIETDLPRADFSDSSNNGTFRNTFYGGFDVNLSQEVKAELGGQFTPYNGISMDEIWKQTMYVTIQARI